MDCPKPTLLDRLLSAGHAGVLFALDGFTRLSHEQRVERLDACKACPNFSPADRTCNLCGCSVDVKAAWRSSTCPDNPSRWSLL